MAVAGKAKKLKAKIKSLNIGNWVVEFREAIVKAVQWIYITAVI